MTASVRIRRETARQVLGLVSLGLCNLNQRAVSDLEFALKPKPERPSQKAKAAKKRTKREETREIYEAVERRADGKCEACAAAFGDADPPQLDHQLGRKHARQSVTNCWLIHRSCHLAKTNNQPGARWWLRRMQVHARQFGHGDTERELDRRIAKHDARRRFEALQGRAGAP